jgi:excisionase family DNA binding protein
MQQTILYVLTLEDLKNTFSEVVKKEITPLIQNNTTSKNQEKLLSRFEVAKLLKISLTTLNDRTKRGLIPAYRLGNRVYYKPEEIENSLIKVRNINHL